MPADRIKPDHIQARVVALPVERQLTIEVKDQLVVLRRDGELILLVSLSEWSRALSGRAAIV